MNSGVTAVTSCTKRGPPSVALERAHARAPLGVLVDTAATSLALVDLAGFR